MEALKTYTVLTVGDGLVTMIPSSWFQLPGPSYLPEHRQTAPWERILAGNLFRKSRPLWIAAGVMGGLAIIPGLPKLSFILMAGIAHLPGAPGRPETAADALAASAEGLPSLRPTTPASDPLDSQFSNWMS
jgi:flagellar biosynthesis protein FlhA